MSRANKKGNDMKLLITTQVRENYGAHDWDGVGECPQYWKSKGGNEYVLRDFKGSDGQAEYAVNELRDQFESNNDYFHEYALSWEIVADDFLTEFEHDQMECDGEIRWPAKVLKTSLNITFSSGVS
jgi:hypothetical protein